MSMRRRDALKGMGMLAGAAALPRLYGCGGSNGPGEISHIVVVMMENRTYDHYVGARALEGLPGNGINVKMGNPGLSDVPVPVFHDSSFCIPDPPHGWEASHAQWNGGKMDGFMRTYAQVHGAGIKHVMGYYQRDDLPFLWAMADQYASCDAWYASVMGPTWPNREYFLSGQSGGLRDNIFPGEDQRFHWKSIFGLLDEHNVSWNYYYQDAPFGILFEDFNFDKMHDFGLAFFDHARNGTLPSVTFIEPDFQLNDDHPPHHPIMGQQFLGSVYAALAASPIWDKCLFVVTYDEHGGYFDHVAPPKTADNFAAQGFDQLGFRVPAFVAGPYVKQGHVSSTVRDHTSVIRHICNTFGLPSLTARDAAANDLSDLIDQERLAAGNPRKPAVLPAIEYDMNLLPAICLGDPENDIHKAIETGFIDKRWDRRHRILDNAYAIGEELDRLGAGRLRRR